VYYYCYKMQMQIFNGSLTYWVHHHRDSSASGFSIFFFFLSLNKNTFGYYYLCMMIIIRRLYHIMWSRKWHNLLFQTLMLFS
jgi:hypothetical protein